MLKTLIGGPKLEHLLIALQRAMNHPGAIVEFGVYHGGTLKIMGEKYPNRTCYGFDTFTGLPAEKWREGEPHGIGDFRDCDLYNVMVEMPPNVELREGLFPQSAEGIDVPVAFAHVDFDYESSTADAIEWLKDRLVPGGIAVFDDYQWPNCPGVEKAIAAAGIPVQKLTQHQVYWINQ